MLDTPTLPPMEPMDILDTPILLVLTTLARGQLTPSPRLMPLFSIAPMLDTPMLPPMEPMDMLDTPILLVLTTLARGQLMLSLRLTLLSSMVPMAMLAMLDTLIPMVPTPIPMVPTATLDRKLFLNTSKYFEITITSKVMATEMQA